MYFNPRSPRGERPPAPSTPWRENNFNPRSPRGERLTPLTHRPHSFKYFNPRSPRGERPVMVDIDRGQCFISIHAPREGSDLSVLIPLPATMISIHAPREGSDLHAQRQGFHFGISIHAPREGSDANTLRRDNQQGKFQSTLPARGATAEQYLACETSNYFNPRSPRGERRLQDRYVARTPGPISIHAPREGSDICFRS